jgi:WD40 repeat protein
MKSFTAHSNQINRIKQTPFNSDYVATCSHDNSVKIWNATTTINNWNLIRSYTGHTNYVYGLEWIDQDTIASGSLDRKIQIWSKSTGTVLLTINTGHGVYCLKLLANGFYLASGLDNYNIMIYNINNGTLVSTLSGHTKLIEDLALINNANLLASSSDDSNVCIWDLTTYTRKFTLSGHSLWVYGLKMISNEILASGSADKSIKMWNITSGNLIRSIMSSDKIYFSVDILNDALTIVSGSYDYKLKLWYMNNGSLLSEINTNILIQTLTVLNITDKSTSN